MIQPLALTIFTVSSVRLNQDWSLVYVGIVSMFFVAGLAVVCVGARRAWRKRRATSSVSGANGSDGKDGGGGGKRGKHRYSLLNGVASRRRQHRRPEEEEMTSRK
jgi:hypothetical protein